MLKKGISYGPTIRPGTRPIYYYTDIKQLKKWVASPFFVHGLSTESPEVHASQGFQALLFYWASRVPLIWAILSDLLQIFAFLWSEEPGMGIAYI
jgi:hypothetical protein